MTQDVVRFVKMLPGDPVPVGPFAETKEETVRVFFITSMRTTYGLTLTNPHARKLTNVIVADVIGKVTHR